VRARPEQFKATFGGVVATMRTCDRLRPKASDFPFKFFAVHGRHDVRTSCAVIEDFVNKMGPEMGSMDVIDTVSSAAPRPTRNQPKYHQQGQDLDSEYGK
jgi:hypothetical protein